MCGKCGNRMTVRYTHTKTKGTTTYYTCQKNAVESGGSPCQYIHGSVIHAHIEKVLKERLTPEAISLSVEVQAEINSRNQEQTKYFELQVEKARYEETLARKRYMNVDPENRLVALELESAWNTRLRHLETAEKEYEDEQKKNPPKTKKELSDKVKGLLDNFTSLWDSDKFNLADKKRVIRYLIEDVTLTDGENNTKVEIRFTGGTTETMQVDHTLSSYETWTTPKGSVDFVRQNSHLYTQGELAELLNAKGYISGKEQLFSNRIVSYVQRLYDIKTKQKVYKERGYLNSAEKAKQLGISRSALIRRLQRGEYDDGYVKVNDKNECYFPPETD